MLTGLDSFAALSVMGHLQHVAQATHQTVIATIHQPRQAIWEMFDTVRADSGGGGARGGRGAGAHQQWAGCAGPVAAATAPAAVAAAAATARTASSNRGSSSGRRPPPAAAAAVCPTRLEPTLSCAPACCCVWSLVACRSVCWHLGGSCTMAAAGRSSLGSRPWAMHTHEVGCSDLSTHTGALVVQSLGLVLLKECLLAYAFTPGAASHSQQHITQQW